MNIDLEKIGKVCNVIGVAFSFVGVGCNLAVAIKELKKPSYSEQLKTAMENLAKSGESYFKEHKDELSAEDLTALEHFGVNI